MGSTPIGGTGPGGGLSALILTAVGAVDKSRYGGWIMKNIIEILAGVGIEIPQDKRSEFDRAVADNYKTVAEYEKKIGRAESERDAWKEKAETAENTLKGFEGVDLDTMKRDLDTWKQKAENAEKDAQAKLEARDFEDALKTELENVKFTSEAAKRAVMQDLKDTGLKLVDGRILGLTERLEQIRNTDATAFVDRAADEGKARFTSSAGQTAGSAAGTKTKAEIMQIRDRAERRAAIKENIHLFRDSNGG